ncbi:hypothetical protein CERZMDRAFT_101444 [Cercospora zeae-maydis SCOH1-5]|uniref:Uncharacterized protein n=1 Tax=Cercospora zeae-maydis SCOH1-5 TaxID=717836 RepID=A0A6A6F365_9PEZI|nr:hypothetical protein CERZMDRAFT_101444 [Cercospora zeae-maydis SCOH1-5]
MPSSSTSTTSQECLILSHYKILCARLCTVGFNQAASTITDWYAGLLESSATELWQHASKDKKWWTEMAEYSNKPGKTPSDGAYAAGNLVSDSAAVLFRFGRNMEATRFCELADEVIEWAQQVEMSEKERSVWRMNC